MSDQFDISLEDGELLNEVELTASLIVAASESDGPLSQAEIDRILGVTPASEGPSERETDDAETDDAETEDAETEDAEPKVTG